MRWNPADAQLLQNWFLQPEFGRDTMIVVRKMEWWGGRSCFSGCVGVFLPKLCWSHITCWGHVLEHRKKVDKGNPIGDGQDDEPLSTACLWSSFRVERVSLRCHPKWMFLAQFPLNCFSVKIYWNETTPLEEMPTLLYDFMTASTTACNSQNFWEPSCALGQNFLDGVFWMALFWQRWLSTVCYHWPPLCFLHWLFLNVGYLKWKQPRLPCCKRNMSILLTGRCQRKRRKHSWLHCKRRKPRGWGCWRLGASGALGFWCMKTWAFGCC